MNQKTIQPATVAIPEATAAVAVSASSTGGKGWTPSATYGALRLMGFGAAEAGNLTALLSGIHPVETGWTVGEIERLLFMRHLVGRGGFGPRAAS